VDRGQIQTLKSKASKKPLPMPEALASILEDYLKGWRENSERLLFVNRRNRPFSADKVVMFKLWPILDALKIPRCGLHAFRHYLPFLTMSRPAILASFSPIHARSYPDIVLTPCHPRAGEKGVPP
jgi:hypothetical protein